MNVSNSEASRSYNHLLRIAEASRALSRLGGEETVGKILTVIKDEGLEEIIGIRLLHRHNEISEDEVMFESPIVDEEGFALVTAATPLSQVVSMTANCWQSTTSGYIPGEYSDPVLLADAAFVVADHKLIFDRLSEALCDHRVESVLGPCLNYSAEVISRKPEMNAAFLEKTDEDNRANVVRYISIADPSFINSAKTKWLAKRQITDDGVWTWATACTCYCAVFPGGGHQGTKYHR